MKSRITIFAVLALASAMVVSAGQIQIGGTNGLTNTPTVIASCTGGCTDQNNYDEVLFNGLTNGGPAPQPYSTYNTFSANVGSITDTNPNAKNADGPGGVTFSMINDGVNANSCASDCDASNNYWSLSGYSSNATISNQQIKVLVGVYGVTDVWTMLNTITAGAASAGDRSIIVTLDFGPTATGAVTDAVVVKFTNTNDIGSGANGQSQNAIDCALDPCNGVATPASGPMASSASVTPAGYGPVTLVTDNLFNYSYNSNGNGTLVLNDQGILLGTLALSGGKTNLTDYLENIKIQENSGSSFPNEALALSAITVDAIPEPSTVIMFLSGLGAIGLARFRRSRS